MSNRVKTGDLAIVVNANNPENNGKICIVLRRPTKEDNAIYIKKDIAGWMVESIGTPFTLRNEVGLVKRLMVVRSQEENLRPIRDLGEDATDEMVLIKPLHQKESV